MCALTVAAAEPQRREWTVAGAKREALVYVPPLAHGTAVPAVFVFHGYGGTMEGAARSLPVHTLWPEALVVYMQALPLPGASDASAARGNGWQNRPGDYGDRDLAFFDAVLETLRTEYPIDERHVFATGHSNGGGFVYLLWAVRPYAFAAFAPCAALPFSAQRLTPKPVLHVAGEGDSLVNFAWQRQALTAVCEINRCAVRGRPWGTNATFFASSAAAPVVALIHPGGHELPPEAASSIVRFFKEQLR